LGGREGNECKNGGRGEYIPRPRGVTLVDNQQPGRAEGERRWGTVANVKGGGGQ